jgi:nucleotide-binding universal stress UspA family protein
MKILLATDGSESAHNALDFLEVFPLPPESELTILTVIDKEVYKNDDENNLSSEHQESLHKTKQMLNEDAEELLEDETARFASPELTWTKLIRYGHPAKEIVQAADELGVDMVVVGNHGLGGVKRFLLGSISDQVLQYSNCSVLIVRPDLTGDTDDSMRNEHPLRILLSYDDSSHSRQAAEYCASLPMHADTEIRALTVMPLVTMFRQDIKQQLSRIWQEKRKVAEKGLAWVTDEVKWPTPHVSSQLRESAEVTQEIIDAADGFDSDLIVVGNKGKGSIKGFLLGSITRRIAHHAPCSVLIVRKGE